MAVVSQELALRYLLELSTDIRAALLVGTDGELAAAAPERPSEGAIEVSKGLAREAGVAGGPDNATSVEIDVRLERSAVFCVREDGQALVCITGPFALPGLILHDLRAVLSDLRRGTPEDRTP
jgi:hypothetical protein